MTSVINQYSAIHQNDPKYGTSSMHHVGNINKLANEYGCLSILDYGCGKGIISQRLQGVTNYDPAIEKFAAKPNPHPMVVCTDVLEHIELENLPEVLTDLKRVTQVIGFFVISLTKAIQILPDGRNAHLIVENIGWWRSKLNKYFTIISETGTPHEARFIVR